MVFTVIRCIRDRVRFTILYLIMMVFLLYIGFSNIGGTPDIQFGFWLGWRSSGVEFFENGDFYSILVIPAGAIVYWCIRKRLIRKTETRNIVTAKQKLEELGIEDSDLNS